MVGAGGAIGFGAAAWKLAVRDRWIGWGGRCREAHLGRVLDNVPFLLLPWVSVKNHASTVLALAAARLPEEFAARYGEAVVLLETFVERLPYPGTCYCAANWQ
ncbi:MAG: Druantia anti-phage system protein DruA [Chromatiaceae bacterium]